MYVSRPEVARAAFGPGNDFLHQNHSIFIKNDHFGGKVHFCAETCSGGLRGAIRSDMDAKSDFTLRHWKGGT